MNYGNCYDRWILTGVNEDVLRSRLNMLSERICPVDRLEPMSGVKFAVDWWHSPASVTLEPDYVMSPQLPLRIVMALLIEPTCFTMATWYFGDQEITQSYTAWRRHLKAWRAENRYVDRVYRQTWDALYQPEAEPEYQFA